MLPANFQEAQAIIQARGIWSLPQWWTNYEVQQFLNKENNMTKEKFIETVKLHGFKMDRFGHLIKTSEKGNKVRYKLQDISVRAEVKVDSKWFRRWSAYYKDIELTPEGKLKPLKFIK